MENKKSTISYQLSALNNGESSSQFTVFTPNYLLPYPNPYTLYPELFVRNYGR